MHEDGVGHASAGRGQLGEALRWRLTAAYVVALTAVVTGCSVSTAPPSSLNPTRYLGVAAVPVAGLPGFERETGVRPGIVEIYTTFGDPLDSGRLSAIIRYGALPLVQLEPYGVSLAAIAAGRYDAYLSHYAADLSQLGHQVILSFAPEANGTWYTWGCRHTSAAAFVAAWRHVHDVITRYDKHVIWLWDVNQSFPGACPLEARWPGSSYVDWTGVDGYLESPGLTFDLVLAPTIAQLRESSDKPVLIAETGVTDTPQAASGLLSIFSGAENIPGVIGIVYFNYATAKHDFRLEQDPSALAVFRREAKQYQSIRRS
jgi:Glycosyl hydrolase family 26